MAPSAPLKMIPGQRVACLEPQFRSARVTRLASLATLIALGAAALALAPGVAHADNVYWSVGVSPAPGVAVTAGNVPQRVYVAPPVYATPVYTAPVTSVYTVPPVVYSPPPVVYTPPPVYYPPSTYYVQPAPVVVYRPAPVFVGQGHWHHGHHGRGHEGRYRY